MNVPKHFTLAAMLILTSAAYGQAESAENACAAPEAQAFGFWAGEWDIQARQRPPGTDQWTENDAWIRTRVRSMFAGCVVVEESIDVAGSDTVVVGMSMTSYNFSLGKYQQLWVDQNGFTWEYIGNWEGEKMVLYLEPAAASGEAQVPFQRTTRIRMVFDEIEENEFVWRYQYSTDEGYTWTSTNEAIYTRR